MRVFIVEDSLTAAVLLRKKLEELGFEVGLAKNGREAWRRLQEQPERLIITDWLMPEMSGLELCRHIRAKGNVPYTYVILMTVKDLRKDRLEGLQAGADDFLTKPVDSVELSTALLAAKRVLAAQAELETRVSELERNNAELRGLLGLAPGAADDGNAAQATPPGEETPAAPPPAAELHAV